MAIQNQNGQLKGINGGEMKNIILFLIVILSSGCVAQSKKLCSEYGFLPGSPEFSVCVMNETHRSQDSWNAYADQMREDSREYQQQLQKLQQLENNRFRTKCTTRPDYLGGSVTECD